MRSQRRLEVLIFFAAFLAFAWFCQGGGWNQNSRFAEVRAIVEQGRFAIDDFLVYDTGEGDNLARIPIQNGDLILGGTTERLSWVGAGGVLLPVNGIAPNENATLVPATAVACSGDIAFARGHFHPNKPPGCSFAATPAYFVIHWIEQKLGLNPDNWRVLTMNAWLSSVFSVGLISAWGCVIFFRLAKTFAQGNTRLALWVTLTFAFGTLFFPFATLLFDHNLTATFLLAAFYWIFSSKNNASRFGQNLYLSGFAAGMAAVTNYVASVAVAMLGLALLATHRRSFSSASRGVAWFSVGVLGPLLIICIYNHACYGSPFALSNSFQNPVFTDDGPKFLGMFGIPDPGVALALLFSPFRGLFYGAPVLSLGVYGLFFFRKRYGAETWLIVGIFALFFFINVTFSGWHAGCSSGPRYLIPALPFLALPMVAGFARFPKISCALACLSAGINLLFAAVDPESPVGVTTLAYMYDRPQWMHSPLTDYALPLFVSGHAWPLLSQLIEQHLQSENAQMALPGATPESGNLDQRRQVLRAVVAHGEPEPIMAAAITGPVSVNPIGVYEGAYFTLFPAGSPETQWNSFNIGEGLFPESQWSLTPLLGIVSVVVMLAWREAKTA